MADADESDSGPWSFISLSRLLYLHNFPLVADTKWDWLRDTGFMALHVKMVCGELNTMIKYTDFIMI
jgi:hypothetical protein